MKMTPKGVVFSVSVAAAAAFAVAFAVLLLLQSVPSLH